MTLKQLRQLYTIGELRNVSIIRNPAGDGFLLEVDLASGTKVKMLKTRTCADKTHAIRVFSSIDGAWHFALEIGFRTALIVAPDESTNNEEFNLT